MTPLALVMITVDRSPSKNYLGETVANLLRSGLSEGVLVVDSGSPLSYFTALTQQGIKWNVLADNRDWRYDLLNGRWIIDLARPRRSANKNVSQALRLGASTGKPWVLFLEDDIDVCADFVGSVFRWLKEFARPKYRLYPLGAAYPFAVTGNRAAEYGVDLFYGTQAVAIRSDDAVSFANYLETWPKNLSGAYDIALQDWAKATYPNTCFLTPAPSFVQHIGRESVINPRAMTHQFASWPGREWRYLNG